MAYETDYPSQLGSQASGNTYPGPLVAEKNPDGDPGSIGGLVALSDQLEAAVMDVTEAWVTFKFGSTPPSTMQDKARESDRLAHVGYSMGQQIARLRDLATEIRNRS